ncbi:MAG: hypothetical protein K5917_06565 [Clostridiales bacterium]|nr:hypothetical protein [Clostridiales bacterium]
MNNQENKEQSQEIAVENNNSGKILKTVFSIIVALIFISYISYQIYKTNYSPVKTETALEYVGYDAIDVQLFTVRDESYIENSAVGSVFPLVTDGKRVANGDDVALVFIDEAAAITYKQIQDITEDIERYKVIENNKSAYSIDINTLDTDINNKLIDCLDAITNGNFDEFSTYTDSLSERVTSRQIAVGETVDFSAKIAQLEEKLNNLKALQKSYSKITAPSSGYYISSVDGYEKTIDYNSLLNLTVQQVDDAINSKPADTGSNVMGKLVSRFAWFFVCTLPNEQAADLVTGDKLTVRLPYAEAVNISVTIEKIIYSDSDRCVLVLRNSYMNDTLAKLRIEQGQLVLNEYTGFKISANAVRVNEAGEKGVYVLSGNKVVFKKIDVIFSTQAYVVVAENTESSGYLKLYDNVIVSGKDLYDGKVIDN